MDESREARVAFASTYRMRFAPRSGQSDSTQLVII